jgi:hypothetical protein
MPRYNQGQGYGGVPTTLKNPQEWGIWGFIKITSAISYN